MIGGYSLAAVDIDPLDSVPLGGIFFGGGGGMLLVGFDLNSSYGDQRGKSSCSRKLLTSSKLPAGPSHSSSPFTFFLRRKSLSDRKTACQCLAAKSFRHSSLRLIGRKESLTTSLSPSKPSYLFSASLIAIYCSGCLSHPSQCILAGSRILCIWYTVL